LPQLDVHVVDAGLQVHSSLLRVPEIRDQLRILLSLFGQ